MRVIDLCVSREHSSTGSRRRKIEILFAATERDLSGLCDCAAEERCISNQRLFYSVFS